MKNGFSMNHIDLITRNSSSTSHIDLILKVLSIYILSIMFNFEFNINDKCY